MGWMVEPVCQQGGEKADLGKGHPEAIMPKRPVKLNTIPKIPANTPIIRATFQCPNGIEEKSALVIAVRQATQDWPR